MVEEVHASTAHKSTTHKVAEKAHEAVDNTEQIAELVEKRIRELADEIREQTRQQIEATQQKSKQISGSANDYMREHPYATLGIAFAAGVIVSSLLKRK